MDTGVLDVVSRIILGLSTFHCAVHGVNTTTVLYSTNCLAILIFSILVGVFSIVSVGFGTVAIIIVVCVLLLLLLSYTVTVNVDVVYRAI